MLQQLKLYDTADQEFTQLLFSMIPGIMESSPAAETDFLLVWLFNLWLASFGLDYFAFIRNFVCRKLSFTRTLDSYRRI